MPHDTGQLSPCATTTEPALWSPRSATRDARAPQVESSPTHCSERKPTQSDEDSEQSQKTYLSLKNYFYQVCTLHSTHENLYVTCPHTSKTNIQINIEGVNALSIH